MMLSRGTAGPGGRMGPLLVVLSVCGVAGGACGGKVEPGPSGSPSSPATDAASPRGAGCEAVCETFRTCGHSTEEPALCVSSCKRDMPDAERARVYAECVQAIPCGELPRALTMDYGPIGVCYSKAIGR